MAVFLRSGVVGYPAPWQSIHFLSFYDHCRVRPCKKAMNIVENVGFGKEKFTYIVFLRFSKHIDPAKYCKVGYT